MSDKLDFSFGAVDIRQRYKVKPVYAAMSLRMFSSTVNDAGNYTRDETFQQNGDYKLKLVVSNVEGLALNNYYNSIGNGNHTFFVLPDKSYGRSLNDYQGTSTVTAKMDDGTEVSARLQINSDSDYIAILVDHIENYYGKGKMTVELTVTRIGLVPYMNLSENCLMSFRTYDPEMFLHSDIQEKFDLVTSLFTDYNAFNDYSYFIWSLGNYELHRKYFVVLRDTPKLFLGLSYESLNQ
ncbi:MULTISPECIES: hypothetical protein [Chitinophagaceae]